MKLKEIPEKSVVHTSTEEEAKELLAILHENGWTWNIGQSLIEKTRWHNADSCYCLYPDRLYVTWSNILDKNFLTLSDFKRLYCEDKKPQSKFKVGDKVKWGDCDTIYTIEEVSTTYKIRNSNGLSYSYAKECSLAPYTEPETKPTIKETKESEETFASDLKPTEDMVAKEKEQGEKGNNPENSQLDLCELLQGHEDEEFFSLLHGDVTLDHISPTTDSCIVVKTRCGSKEYFYRDGRWSRDGIVMFFPSRALYEQYPLDAAKAWSVWQSEQKKPFICIHWGEVDTDGNEEEDYTGNIYFRTASDRDQCIEEINAVIEKHINK